MNYWIKAALRFNLTVTNFVTRESVRRVENAWPRHADVKNDNVTMTDLCNGVLYSAVLCRHLSLFSQYVKSRVK